MGFLKKAWTFIFDHKTYAISMASAVMAGLLASGKMTQEQYLIAMAMLAPGGLASLRSAVTTESAKVMEAAKEVK